MHGSGSGLPELIYWLERFLGWAVCFPLESATSAREAKRGRVGAGAPQTILFPHISVLNQSLAGCAPTKRGRWVWLRLEGVQLTWLGPLFPSKRLKEREGGGNQCASGAVASHGSSSLCSHSCLSFPWLCLNRVSLTFLLLGSHVTRICVWRSLQAPRFLDSPLFLRGQNKPRMETVFSLCLVYRTLMDVFSELDMIKYIAFIVPGLFCRGNICCSTHTLVKCSHVDPQSVYCKALEWWLEKKKTLWFIKTSQAGLENTHL